MLKHHHCLRPGVAVVPPHGSGSRLGALAPQSRGLQAGARRVPGPTARAPPSCGVSSQHGGGLRSKWSGKVALALWKHRAAPRRGSLAVLPSWTSPGSCSPTPTPPFLEPTLLAGPAPTPAPALSLPGRPRITVLILPWLRAASRDRSPAGGVVILLIAYLTVKHLTGPVPGPLGVPRSTGHSSCVQSG